ncbi:MAG: chemotaxis protein CheW [Anaerolineae bacterium]|nr:chemotaxis protein CheW [Anaerolineae bacterium]MDQ7037192.1 chemotaxis protein CheW [Anaerolineae bacterium]
MDKHQTSRLYALWDELNQDDTQREQDNLQMRLSQRAKVYATPQKQEATYSEDETYHVLTFQLGKERYAIDVAHVRGVRPVGSITRVPSIPNFYRGVINMRGRILTVLDLRYFFNIGTDKSDMPSELVIAETEDLQLAILAHYIEEVTTIPRETVAAVDMKYARGVTAERLVILDIQTLFSDDRLIIGGKADSS